MTVTGALAARAIGLAAMSLSLAGVLLAALAVYRGAEALLDRFPRVYEHPARWSNHANTLWIERQLAERDRPAILLSGSSTTRTAIDEEIVNEALGGGYFVENISNSTTDPAGIYYWLRYLEANDPAALPDILVQGIEEVELQDETNYPPLHSHLTHFFADADVFAQDPVLRPVMEDPETRDLVRLESGYPLFARRALLQGVIVGRLVWPGYESGLLARHWLSRFHLRPYDWNYFRVVRRPSTSERRLRGLRSVAADGAFQVENYDYPNTQTQALRATAAFCARHGILHFAVVMPGVPEKFGAFIDPVLEARLRTMIDDALRDTGTRLIWAWHFLPGEDFFDSLHISQHGRGPLSRMIAAELEQRLTALGRGGDGYRRTPNTVAQASASPSEPVYGPADRERFVVPGDVDRKR